MLQFSFVAEWIAFLFSFLLFSKGVKKEYQVFFLYTLCVVILEYVGWRMANVVKVPNHALFTIVCFFYLLFYFYTVHFFLENTKFKRWVKVFISLFVGFYAINILFIQQLSEFNSYSFIFGYSLLIIACTFYFIEFLSRNEVTIVWREPQFFIVCGYFFYGGLTAMLYVVHGYFAYLKVPVEYYKKVVQHINDLSNGSLYLLLSISFIILWTRRR